MQKFCTLTSKATPLPLKDVDTDMIIPAQFLTRINKSGYGECLFRRLRDNDPDFPIDQLKYKGNQILIARNNFGCGSSREHAVWALLDFGIKVVVSSSFADIFKSNAGKNGLVLIELEEKIIENLLEKAETGGFEMTIDLKKQTLSLSDGTIHEFDFDPFRKECILNGLDDMDYILQYENEIKKHNSIN